MESVTLSPICHVDTSSFVTVLAAASALPTPRPAKNVPVPFFTRAQLPKTVVPRSTLGFVPLPPFYFVFLGGVTLTYLLFVEFVKRRVMQP